VPARISSIAARSRQQREREPTVRRLERGAIVVQLLGRHRAQFVVVGILGHIGEAVGLLAQPPHLARRLRDRLELGIFLRDLNEAVGRQLAGRHQRLQLVAARLDLGDAIGGDGGHAGIVPAMAAARAPPFVIPAKAEISLTRGQPAPTGRPQLSLG
jgi:hypothetical protein